MLTTYSLLILFFVLLSDAGISKVKQGIQLWRFAVITREDSVFGTSDPYLKFNYEFSYPKSIAIPPNPQMALFHHQNYRTKIGREADKWCCTEDLYNRSMCPNLGGIFIQDGNKNINQMEWTNNQHYLIDETKTLFYWPNFKGYKDDNSSSSVLSHANDIIKFNKTGVWYLLLVHCNSSITVGVSGQVEWRNPYGYLSGSLYPFLPMYVCISIAFFCLLVVWIVFIVKYRENLMGLQHVITTSIIISFAENVLWSIDYVQYNLYGNIIDYFNMIGALLTASKLTIIRTCILLVALGYSITVPTLERRTKIYVGVLTVIYLFVVTLYEYGWVLITIDIDYPALLVIIINTGLVVANCAYVFWIGQSLFQHWKSLTQLKQTQKLDMYKKFTAFLVIFLAISVVLFFFQTVLYAMNQRDELWQLWWFWDAYWEFGYFFVILLIAVLWWPNKNNTRYAYSVQIDAEEMGDIGLPTDDSDSEPRTKLEIQEDDISDLKGSTVVGNDSDSD